MKPKYYLARLLCGSMQYSDEYWTSYEKAIKVRSRQVNPSQWMVIVNPLNVGKRSRVKIESDAQKRSEQLRKAYEILRDLTL